MAGDGREDVNIQASQAIFKTYLNLSASIVLPGQIQNILDSHPGLKTLILGIQCQQK